MTSLEGKAPYNYNQIVRSVKSYQFEDGNE